MLVSVALARAHLLTHKNVLLTFFSLIIEGELGKTDVGCVFVINIITLFFVWNIYFSIWTMDHVLFNVRLKFIHDVSTNTLLV